MPDVPHPDELPDERELMQARLASIPEAMREMMQRERPIEQKRVEPIDYANPKKMPHNQHTRFRAR
jgi:acyl-CoA thioesterase-2